MLESKPGMQLRRSIKHGSRLYSMPSKRGRLSIGLNRHEYKIFMSNIRHSLINFWQLGGRPMSEPLNAFTDVG